MKKFVSMLLLFACLMVLAYPMRAEDITLSDSASISLLTCGSGDELYSAFGHTGIRVTDYEKGFDVVFNYGTFDFDQPGFYTNFLKGKMRYMLAVESFRSFYYQYQFEERKVLEQKLLLNAEYRKKIFALLAENAKPENREYYYDFFWDNCSTRPRDIFEKALGSRLVYDTANGQFAKDKTLHDMLRLCVYNRPWIDYGFDLILGLPCEIPATPRRQTFLPLYLSYYEACAKLDGHLFASPSVVVLNAFPRKPTIQIFTPLVVNVLIFGFALLLTFFELKNNRHHAWFDLAFYFTAGLLGTLFLSLWLFSSHYSVPWNLNLLWLLPTHLLAAFWIWKGKPSIWKVRYVILSATLVFLVLVMWFVSPQPFHPAIIPLLLTFLLRTYVIRKFSTV